MSTFRMIVKGAFFLTVAGFISRILGFFYRIFLSHTIGAEGLGIYQLIFPLYTLAIALTISGIETAISRYVSEREALGQSGEGVPIFCSGLFLSISLSSLATLLLIFFSHFLANVCLKEPRCQRLLVWMALSLPFGSIHACIHGYFLGRKKSQIPAILQVVEQLFRIGGAFAVYLLLKKTPYRTSPLIPISGLVISEIAAALLSILFFLRNPKKESSRHLQFRHWCRLLLNVAMPVTANHAMMSLIQGVETILIPQRLVLFGLSQTTALSIYGTLTGLTLPLLLFPTAITASFCAMLLPAASESHAREDYRTLSVLLERVLQYSFLLGIFCMGIFFFFGISIGQVLFHNTQSGLFLHTLALLAPFLYLNSLLGSVLYGLGAHRMVFRHTMLALFLRILAVWFLIPICGINAYFYVLIGSQILLTVLHLSVLRKQFVFHWNIRKWLLEPSVGTLLSIGWSFYFSRLFQKAGTFLELFGMLTIALAFYIIWSFLLNFHPQKNAKL